MSIKLGRILIVVGVIVVMSFGLYGLNQKRLDSKSQAQSLSQELSALKAENNSLKASIAYYKNPANLLKELKSQFNYRESGENLIIVVPQNSSTTSSTTP